ncbi:MAG TPA: FixG Ig-like domain-containing protein, partial [Thermoplasmata archaeon]|nr:FixG Ig-like domain-containing protein [Thermoplasmata archaeon]
VLSAVTLGAAASLALRVPLKVDVIRDRAGLAREVEGGKIENVYRLQIMNTEERSHRFVIKVTGPDELEHLEILTEAQPLEIGPASTRAVPVRVRAEPEHAHRRSERTRAEREHALGKSERITFIVEASDDEKHPLPEIFSIREKSSFFVPRESR